MIKTPETLAWIAASKEASARMAPYHKARDDLLLRVISKLRPLSTADLNELNALLNTIMLRPGWVSAEELWPAAGFVDRQLS
jgi:hypothetical protein